MGPMTSSSTISSTMMQLIQPWMKKRKDRKKKKKRRGKIIHLVSPEMFRRPMCSKLPSLRRARLPLRDLRKAKKDHHTTDSGLYPGYKEMYFHQLKKASRLRLHKSKRMWANLLSNRTNHRMLLHRFQNRRITSHEATRTLFLSRLQKRKGEKMMDIGKRLCLLYLLWTRTSNGLIQKKRITSHKASRQAIRLRLQRKRLRLLGLLDRLLLLSWGNQRAGVN